MITRILTNAGAPLTYPDGALATGIKVSFELVTNQGVLTDVFDSATGERIPPKIITATTDASGVFSVNLWPTTRGDAPVYYLCKVPIPGVNDIVAPLPDNAGPYTWVQFKAGGVGGAPPWSPSPLEMLDVSAWPSLADAIGDASTYGKTLWISTPVTCNDLDTTGRDIRVLLGGRITVNAGHTLTIGGGFDAGLYQVFAGAGSVMLSGGNEIAAEWFATLSIADAVAYASGKRLVISSVYTTPPAALSSTIKIVPGGKLNGTGATTINGVFEGCSGCLNPTATYKFSAKSVRFVRPYWFGTLDPTATVDNTAQFQAAINAAIANIGTAIHAVQMPAGRYLVQGGLSVIAQNPTLSVDGNVLAVIGAGGGAVTTNTGLSTTLVKNTAGKILAICENSDGTYPGGGVGVVTHPLSWLRRVRLENFNFEGDPASPNTVDAIGGRGVYRSEFRRLGFSWLRDGIRLGKRLASSQETSADSIQLDYCERNTIENVNMRSVELMLHVLSPDILTIKNSYLSQCNTTGGRVLYVAGGNDFVDMENNIIHPYVTGTNAALTKAIEIAGGTRGIRGRGNHVEGLNGTLFYGGPFEIIDWQNNLFYGAVQSTQNIFNVTITKYGSLICRNNIIAMPNPSVTFFNAIVIGDDGAYSQLATCNFDIDRNKVTTTLAGTTSYNLTSNWSGVGIGPGRWLSPLQLIPGAGFYWYDGSVPRYKKTAPTSVSDGVIWGEVAYAQGTIAFPGVTVAAGSNNAVTLGITGALPGRFVKLAPDVSTQGLIWSVNPYGGSNVEIKFYNPTASPITLAAGTWLYKIELQ